MGVRPATEGDIPALKDIVLSGLKNDSIWEYCLPSSSHGATAADYVEHVLRQCLEPKNGSWLVSVVEVPKTHQVVSLSIWQTIHEHESEENSIANQISRGVYDTPSPTRCAIFAFPGLFARHTKQDAVLTD
ncbi:hypothetical protein FZEAL_4839 [Fusarium zealandicum]|uniref:Uncharacterized protein n=1 Tax=Fusarium zealandicum TaxID=1053134 RepID=A0A8H4XKE1_9HYPO|nr:hypothetical protein FZEAL_4839 [Fusarium zealandicum]